MILYVVALFFVRFLQLQTTVSRINHLIDNEFIAIVFAPGLFDRNA